MTYTHKHIVITSLSNNAVRTHCQQKQYIICGSSYSIFHRCSTQSNYCVSRILSVSKLQNNNMCIYVFFERQGTRRLQQHSNYILFRAIRIGAERTREKQREVERSKKERREAAGGTEKQREHKEVDRCRETQRGKGKQKK